MVDDSDNITTGRLRSFDRAVRAKWNKYIGSGVIILIIGLLVLIFTVAVVHTGSTSNILLLGLGILLIIIGIVRMLIGLINPATPLDTAAIPVAAVPVETLDAELFQEPPSAPLDPVDD